MRKIAKVLYYISDYCPVVSGTTYRLANTIEHLNRTGTIAKIMTPQVNAHSVYSEEIIEVPHRLPLRFVPYEVEPYCMTLPFISAGYLGKVLETEKPDIVHIVVNLPDLGVSTLIDQCRKHNVPFVVGYHTYVLDHIKDLPWPLKAPGTYLTNRYYDYLKKFVPIIAPSTSVVDMLGLRQENELLVWGPAIKTALFPVSPQWDARRLAFVYTGRITKTKGLDELIEIFQQLRLLGDYHLYLCGPVEDGKYYEVIEKNDNISLKKAVGYSEVHAVLHQATYFISCSRTETLGNTLLEAMMCGLVPFCVPMHGSKTLVSPDKNGIYLDKPSARENAELIHQEIKNTAKMEALRADAIRFASTYSVESSTDGLLSHYQRAVETWAAHRPGEPA